MSGHNVHDLKTWLKSLAHLCKLPNIRELIQYKVLYLAQ